MLSDRGGDGGEQEADHPWRRRGIWWYLEEKRKLIFVEREKELILGSKVVFLKRCYPVLWIFCALQLLIERWRRDGKRSCDGVDCKGFYVSNFVEFWRQTSLWLTDKSDKIWQKLSQESDKIPTAATDPVNPWNSKNAELCSLWYQTTSLFLHAFNLTLLPMSEKPFTEITYKQTIRFGGQQQLTTAFLFSQTWSCIEA